MHREGERSIKNVYIQIRATKELQTAFKEKSGIARTLLIALNGRGRNLPYPETAEIVLAALDEYINALQRNKQKN